MTAKTRQLRLLLTAGAIIAGWVSTFAIGVWTASADRAHALEAIHENAQTLDDHEARLRVLEQTATQIAVDVSWIRDRMEEGGR